MHEKIKQHKVNDIQKKRTWYKIGIAMRYHFSSIKQYETKKDKKKNLPFERMDCHRGMIRI